MSKPKRVKYWQAINEGIAEEMDRDPSVIMIGQDVGKPGGTFGETRDLLNKFGPERVYDVPISEQAIVGSAVGAAIAGARPIVEILFIDFLGIGSDQLVNQAAKYFSFSGGRASVPMVLKTAVGTELGMGAQHSQSLESWYAQIPGLKVCWASTPRDAKELMKAAVRDDNPVLFIESFSLLRLSGEVGGPDEVGQLGAAEVVCEGSDITVVTWGTMRHKCLDAAEQLQARGISVELIDLRTITSWDRDTVFESVRKTNRCAVVTEAPTEFGPSGEIASAVGEYCLDWLDAPIRRIGSPKVLAPQFAEYDRLRVPQGAQIAEEVERMLEGAVGVSGEEER